MAFRDLREYITKLEEVGELQRVKAEVDWNLEVGAVIRRSYELGAQAPLFEKLKDYPQGYRILGAPVGGSNKPNCYYARTAISLGMPMDSSPVEIIEEYVRKKRFALKPVLVSTGPCKENILLGEEVDLLKFPAPFLHEGDGGRYIGTWHVVITKDPDSGWNNWATYRLMIHDKKSMGGLLMPFRHIGLLYYQKFEPQNRPMEFAVAIGTEPTTPVVCFGGFPEGVSEPDIVGGFRGEPLELVKAETVDLEVPASAEIILEGVVNPHERRDEGPFAEYSGYAGITPKAPRPVYHVTAITHRNDPILPCMGVSINNARVFGPLILSGDILEELRSKGLPIKMAFAPPNAVANMLVVSTKTPYPNIAKKIAHAVWAARQGSQISYVVVVEDDVDITKPEELIWIIATRCHPEKNIYRVPHVPSHPLIPYLSPTEKKSLEGAYALLDCTWPKDWPDGTIPVRTSLDTLWPKDIKDKVLNKWEHYGYKGSGGQGFD